MAGLIVFLVVFGAVFKLGHLMGERRERERHERAVSEATRNITSLESWKR